MGGGTTLFAWLRVKKYSVYWGLILMILGVILKLVKCSENCARLWVASSVIFINKVIYVDEGNENTIGILTGYPIVESTIDGTLIVGVETIEVSLALVTVILTGRMFLKYYYALDYAFVK